MYEKLFWLGLMLVFLIAEGASPAVVSLWFALGSLGALIASLCGVPIWVQVVIFFLVSGVTLALLRPLAKKHLNNKVTATNVDSVIGSAGTVTVTIDNVKAEGQVKLGSMQWSARSTSGQIIVPETTVKVDRVEGVKVYVTPISPEEAEIPKV